MAEQETFAFQAEISQLMSLIVNAFYSKKEIFLRELISNSSDAIDKIRYLSLQQGSSILDANPELVIKIIPDKDNKQLTILDSGIGMTKTELINNLGTIARSGTKSFMEALQKEQTDLSMIGQFGVGFYSAYLVANKVVVTSKHNDDEQYIWESEADGSFTIRRDIHGPPLGRGTKISLHLKDDQLTYLEESTLKDTIKKHSEFIQYPIQLLITKEIEESIPKSSTTPSTNQSSKDESSKNESCKDESCKDESCKDESCKDENCKDESCKDESCKDESCKDESCKDESCKDESCKDESAKIEDDDEEEKGEVEKIKKIVKEYEQVNKTKPIWTRNPKEITKEEYAGFYKALTNDWEDHLAVKHFSVEGQLEFRALLFVPKKAPFDMFDNHRKVNNIKLYVRRVFIMDDCRELIPEWLSFVKGVVDSNDLPLNISREMLQQNRIMKMIKKNIVKKSIELFEEIAENADDYKTFYNAFAKNIKYGLHEDTSNSQRLAKLLRFYSTRSNNEQNVSFDKYIENMPPEQKDIYFLAGESKTAIANSPFLEGFKKKGIEVLLMVDAIDEYVTNKFKEYNDKKLISITKEGLELPKTDEEKAKFDDLKKRFEPLLTYIKDSFPETLEKVVCTDRLSSSPCCLVTTEYGYSANMQRLMRNQVLANNNLFPMTSKKILEINPTSPIIQELLTRFQLNSSDKTIKDLVHLLFDTALISSGFSLEEPSSFASRIHKMISLGLSINDSDEPLLEDIPCPPDNTSDNDESSKMETID